MTAQMTPKLEEARLRELEGAEARLRDPLTVPWSKSMRLVSQADLRMVLDALSAERERGDRAVEIVMAIKDGPMIECIPDNDIQDMIRAFLATQKAEGAET